MKVVHVSTTDYGGAYKAAARISESMRANGADSEILIRTKRYDDTPGVEAFRNPVQKILSKGKNGINLLLSRGEVISDYIGTNITRHPLVKNADVIILHWVNSFVSYKTVERLGKLGKPVIWVMHDMWLFTGGCHVDKNCGGYERQCGFCPYLRGRKDKDVSRKNFIRKHRMLERSEIVLAGPSRWIVDCASKSLITGHQQIERIPNPINTDIYKPIEDKSGLRNKYNIPQNKKVILYGAVNATGDRNKGYHFLVNALRQIDTKEYLLIIFGNKDKDSDIEKIIDTVFMGYIKDERILIELYNLADVFAAPSQQENYPNSVLESSACGTPVAAFQIGGIPDIVDHEKTGILAPYGDTEKLAHCIEHCAENAQQMGAAARKRIEEINGYDRIGKMYIMLAENMLERKQYEK